jgi:peroxiredoxin
MVAISPEPPDASLTTAERNELKYGVLSDVGGAIARQYGVMFKVPGGDGKELPLAATYVIDTDGTIAYAFVESDYRQRAEPQAIIDALTKLRREAKTAN